jgi:hypothetical protein
MVHAAESEAVELREVPMKARNLTIQGTKIVLKNYLYFSGPTSTAAFLFKCVPGAMVHGNFHDPNGWGYDIDERQYWKGSTYTNFNGVLTETRGFHGTGDVAMVIPAWERTLVYNMALERLNNKVRGALDVSIALAEARTTMRMVRSLSKVIDFARAVKRKFGSTKDIANGWLQWQYGWKPLVSDVFNILDEATNTVDNATYAMYASATKPIWVNEKVNLNVPGISGVRTLRKGSGKASCRIHVAIDTAKLIDVAKWSSLNPLSIAWELTPFSFVFDWFYDVGSYMRAMETALLSGNAFKTGYKSELFVFDCTESTDPGHVQVISSPPPLTAWARVNRKTRWRQFSRTKLGSYPMPYPPKFSADLSSERLLTTAALLRQILR